MIIIKMHHWALIWYCPIKSSKDIKLCKNWEGRDSVEVGASLREPSVCSSGPS